MIIQSASGQYDKTNLIGCLVKKVHNTTWQPMLLMLCIFFSSLLFTRLHVPLRLVILSFLQRFLPPELSFPLFRIWAAPAVPTLDLDIAFTWLQRNPCLIEEHPEGCQHCWIPIPNLSPAVDLHLNRMGCFLTVLTPLQYSDCIQIHSKKCVFGCIYAVCTNMHSEPFPDDLFFFISYSL